MVSTWKECELRWRRLFFSIKLLSTSTIWCEKNWGGLTAKLCCVVPWTFLQPGRLHLTVAPSPLPTTAAIDVGNPLFKVWLSIWRPLWTVFVRAPLGCYCVVYLMPHKASSETLVINILTVRCVLLLQLFLLIEITSIFWGWDNSSLECFSMASWCLCCVHLSCSSILRFHQRIGDSTTRTDRCRDFNTIQLNP
jgi:hypothetical protein